MKRLTRSLYSAACIIVATMTMGCTKVLDDVVREASYSSYKENISSILITEDGKQLVVLGRRYHYVLETPPHLADILKSPIDKHIVAKIPPLFAEADGNITGDLYLVMDEDAPPAIVERATSFGFHSGGWQGKFAYAARLVGTRYIVEKSLPPAPTTNLRQTYTIQIDEPKEPKGEKALQQAISPVTTAADGVLMLGALPLFAVTALLLGDH